MKIIKALGREKFDFSPGEESMLALLRKHGPLNTVELADLHYKKRKRPWHAMIIINSTMRSLMAKIERNKESFIVERSLSVGRGPLMYKVKRAS
jgi:hypothetical protein